ncbi:uncharacterized protein BKA55DRAFT_542955 [Fusarium redolens]|uniref:2EXR domain-containing protein n=1 Tax=Fusarium redolens TaxID=48865 RepID=A0A9P9GLW5_FUSRE|nr:uncharacterized protein BKA55DRAFT_542955 [Fusarium redolens]KAH7240369.1 hypothetical protein BKA55DRAFT_542955 [Fusarium redolens]
MATTFHLFPFLPQELRDEIWAFALRSHHRGVQIFRVHKSTVVVRPGDRNIAPMLDERNNSWHFAAPLESKYYKSLDESPNKNVSTYMIDSGLWTACKESRRVIRKRFAKHSNNPWGPPRRAIVSYCSGSSPFCLSIWPGSDLIILQPDDFFPTSWSRIVGLAYTPGPYVYPLDSCREIGIEYDPEWGDGLPAYGSSWGSRNMTLAIAHLFSSSPRHRLWLVDTNLKRKADASSVQGGKTMQFYANDRKLVQVSLDKGAHNLREWEYMHPVGNGAYQKSSICFAISANVTARFFEEMNRVMSMNYGYRLEGRVGLLGWEDLKKS